MSELIQYNHYIFDPSKPRNAISLEQLNEIKAFDERQSASDVRRGRPKTALTPEQRTEHNRANCKRFRERHKYGFDHNKPDPVRAEPDNHKQTRAEYMRDYRIDHRAEIYEKRSVYYRDHRERELAYQKEYNKRKKEAKSE